jgi:ABC-type nitrate/sulfonate/bicarbonate transport system permease component
MHHAWASLVRACLGFGIGSLLGLLVGSLMFASRRVGAVLHTFLACIAPIPPLALSPFLILWFRLAYSAQVGLIALGSFMILAYSTYQALQQVDMSLRRAAWSLGARGPSYYADVLLPAILPSLVGPLRISLASAIALSTIAEFMGAQEGLGVLVMVARRTLETATILLAIAALGVMSFLLDLGLRKALQRLTRWN